MMNPEQIWSSNRPDVLGWFIAGMPDHWRWASWLKYRGELSSADYYDLELKLWHMAVKQKARLGWKVKKGNIGKAMLRDMAKLALVEMADPNRFRTPNAWYLRASSIGVSKSSWFSTWNGRYQALYNELDEWTNRGYRFIEAKASRNSRVAKELAEIISENEINWMEIAFKEAG